MNVATSSRWRVRFPSLGARLVGLFLVLAVAVGVTFMLGLHVLRDVGLHEYLRPLVLNYTDTLVAEIGSPPDVDRARVLTQRLPLHIRIEGPTVNWDSADEPPPPPPQLNEDGRPRPPRHPVVTLPNGDPLPLVVPEPRPPRSAPGGVGPRGSPHGMP